MCGKVRAGTLYEYRVWGGSACFSVGKTGREVLWTSLHPCFLTSCTSYNSSQLLLIVDKSHNAYHCVAALDVSRWIVETMSTSSYYEVIIVLIIRSAARLPGCASSGRAQGRPQPGSSTRLSKPTCCCCITVYVRHEISIRTYPTEQR